MSECPDDEKDWFPQRHVCYVEMQLKAANRMYEKLHEDAPWHDGKFRIWAKEFSPVTPFHAWDGVTIWLSETELDPESDFLRPSGRGPL